MQCIDTNLVDKLEKIKQKTKYKSDERQIKLAQGNIKIQ